LKATATLLILVLFILSLNLPTLTVGSRVIEVPKDYSGIQVALDEANPGDVIRVASGTYFEKVRVRKPLSLIGEGSNKTVIDGGKKMVVVEVYADNVEIRGFTVRNGTYGIFLWYCSGALLRNNVMTNNTWNFGVWGDSLHHYFHDVDSSNLVDGKSIYYWLNQHGKRVPKDAGYVALINCTNITMEDAILTSNEQGVLLVNTNYSLIENVTILGNDRGIDLHTSNNNTVRMNNLISINWHAIYCISSQSNTFTGNTIREGDYGILTQNSYENTIFHNNFINNTDQLHQLNSSNVWDNGREGNYWSDYMGVDLDSDGVGDTMLPHLGVDYHPLVKIFDEIQPRADAGTNQTVMKNEVVAFDASGSWDNVGIVAFKWDFGDGSNGTGATTSHAYSVAGVYTVTLTVTDLSGQVATDTIFVTVVNPPVPLTSWISLAVISTLAIILLAVFWLRRSSRKKKV